MPAQVLCVRHGLSTWNLARRWQGQADPPLSDEGRAGVVELGDSLAATLGSARAVQVWSSDLRRAVDTATILAGRLGAGPVSIDPRLREADIGPWEGLTSGEIEDGWPGFLADGRRPGGFEHERDLLARVLPALEDVAAGGTEALPIVVAHAGVLRAVRRHVGAVDEHLPNLAGLWFDVAPGAIRYDGLFAAADASDDSPQRL